MEGWVEVNCDGAVSAMEGKFACGGLITNHGRRFIMGFSKTLEDCSVIKAKL